MELAIKALLTPCTREGTQNQVSMSLMKGPLSSVTFFPPTILYINLHLLPLSLGKEATSNVREDKL